MSRSLPLPLIPHEQSILYFLRHHVQRGKYKPIDLYNSYTQLGESYGWQDISNTKFGLVLKTLGIQKKRTKAGNIYTLK